MVRKRKLTLIEFLSLFFTKRQDAHGCAPCLHTHSALADWLDPPSVQSVGGGGGGGPLSRCEVKALELSAAYPWIAAGLAMHHGQWEGRPRCPFDKAQSTLNTDSFRSGWTVNSGPKSSLTTEWKITSTCRSSWSPSLSSACTCMRKEQNKNKTAELGLSITRVSSTPCDVWFETTAKHCTIHIVSLVFSHRVRVLSTLTPSIFCPVRSSIEGSTACASLPDFNSLIFRKLHWDAAGLHCGILAVQRRLENAHFLAQDFKWKSYPLLWVKTRNKMAVLPGRLPGRSLIRWRWGPAWDRGCGNTHLFTKATEFASDPVKVG